MQIVFVDIFLKDILYMEGSPLEVNIPTPAASIVTAVPVAIRDGFIIEGREMLCEIEYK